MTIFSEKIKLNKRKLIFVKRNKIAIKKRSNRKNEDVKKYEWGALRMGFIKKLSNKIKLFQSHIQGIQKMFLQSFNTLKIS